MHRGGGGVTPWLTRQVSFRKSTCGGDDVSLLVQQLYGRLAFPDSLRIAARVRLAIILSADEALCNLGTFAFITSYLFSAGRRHLSAVADLFRIIKRLGGIHPEVQGMISSPHLSTTFLYDMSRQWSHYLNKCMSASDSEVVEAPGGGVLFYLKPILVDLEEGCYIGPIIPISLVDLVAGRRSVGAGAPRSGDSGSNGVGGGGGIKKFMSKVGAMGRPAQVWAR